MKNVFRKLGLGAGYLLILVAFASTAQAVGGDPVPEVDPGSVGTALAVVVGGYLVIVSRFRRK